jgi:hypothetical protein
MPLDEDGGDARDTGMPGMPGSPDNSVRTFWAPDTSARSFALATSVVFHLGTLHVYDAKAEAAVERGI